MTDEEKIAAFIREGRVTYCPPAWASGAERHEPEGDVLDIDLGWEPG